MFGVTEARRAPGKRQHHDRKGTTRGVCNFSDKKDGQNSEVPGGWVELSQAMKDDGNLAETNVKAYMGYLTTGETYSLELRDDT